MLLGHPPSLSASIVFHTVSPGDTSQLKGHAPTGGPGGLPLFGGNSSHIDDPAERCGFWRPPAVVPRRAKGLPVPCCVFWCIHFTALSVDVRWPSIGRCACSYHPHPPPTTL
uniref:Uncharacterized protein n=1 Tax=Eutreptiella gymnastica TaxID=73025 RepID=A0A7S4CJZ0_9EUGL